MIASWMTACFRSKTVTKEDGLEFVMDAQKGRIEGRVWSSTVTRENEINFKMDRRKAIQQLTGFSVVVLFARIYGLRQNVPKPVRMVGRLSVQDGGSVANSTLAVGATIGARDGQ